jgi:hypothetical protein
MVGLITEEEEKNLMEKMLDYYKKLYPGVDFRTEEAELTHDQIGELDYTYAGAESEVTAEEKMRAIAEAIGHGYSTPILVLKRRDKMVLLDGHRRVRVVYPQGISWKAYLIIPGDEDVEFGIEGTIMGKVKDLWKKQ